MHATYTDPDGKQHLLQKRTPFRTSTCRECGGTIDKEKDMIVRVPRDDDPTKFRWVHEECAHVAMKRQHDKSSKPTESTTSEKSDGLPEEHQVKSTTESKSKPEKPSEPLSTAEGKLEAVKQIMEGKNPFEAQMKQMIEDAMSEAQPQTKRIEIKTEIGSAKVEGLSHPKMGEIIELLAMKKNVLLVGPTGSGKTHTARQVAEHMFGENANVYGLQTIEDPKERFGFVSCSMGMSEGALMGRLLPVGKDGQFEYVWGEFIKKFENGGLFLWDEMDGSDPNVLLSVNAALSNGVAAVYNRPEKPYATMHENFRCIAAANTWGRGGDRRYCGRSPLDEATLDRFRLGTIEFDYDQELEGNLCLDCELYSALCAIRAAIFVHRLERVVSTRYFVDAYDAVKSGWTVKRVVERLISGWRKDEVEKIKDIVEGLK